MNGIEYLIDTNILIYILQGNPCVKYFAQSEVLSISGITEMEILGKYQINESEKEVITTVMNHCSVFDIDSRVKKATIKIKQENKIKLPDAIIAATAMVNGLSLVTADKGFQRIRNLDLILIDIQQNH
jgi:predicted nucleic acid-binding protein